MTLPSINHLLDSLDDTKRRFDKRSAIELLRLLKKVAGLNFKDAELLIRFHEALLFLRAYPHSNSGLKLTETVLQHFARRVDQLREADADLSPLDDPEVSGIAGTSVTSNFSYEIIRWLVATHPSQLAIDWEWFDDEERLGAIGSRFMPLLEEDAVVEANVPYFEWVRAAKGQQKELAWLIARFASLQMPTKAKAELYDSLKLHVRWTPSFRATRTGMKLPVRKVFYHDTPLITRRDVSLAAELNSPPLTIKKLSSAQGERILDLARETSATRYRELHGFTYGDPRRVLHANIGRGVDLYFNGVPPERRLPLRAYHSAMIFKNGVPVGYFEGLSLFERMESGFNFYYTFREGETAWIYARVLRLCRQLLGVTAISIDPYQVGYENEEGIESGAFWFYRKLGFRPVRPELLKLTLAEEKKIVERKGYRTPYSVLRKLAKGHMLFQTPSGNSTPSESTGLRKSDLDSFQIRNIGLSVQRRMATQFRGDANLIRAASVAFTKHTLKLRTNHWKNAELEALENFALVLAQIPGISKWSELEKAEAARVIRAKAGPDEARYLKLMQRHQRLREEMISLGSLA